MNQPWLVRLTDNQLSFWLQQYPKRLYTNKQILWIQAEFKRRFDIEIQAYPQILTTFEITAIRRLVQKLEALELDYKKKIQKGHKITDPKKIFPTLEDILTYLQLGHISTDKTLIEKGLELANLNLGDYYTFCLNAQIKPHFIKEK